MRVFPEYVTINCPEELLPQVVGELLSFTYDADAVDVVHGPEGREIRVHPMVADAWFLKHNPPEPTPAPAPEPVSPVDPPVVAAPVPSAPKSSTKKTTSA